ncbi:MAG: hypothetical protein KF757_06205 [Phycisphaeraceae bacterium]|nr:hypothetical protein [Phycisphaeraceae bacterium]MCW5763767.1 hypothetical protein [Phycisphaeraceae bacterium]
MSTLKFILVGMFCIAFAGCQQPARRPPVTTPVPTTTEGPLTGKAVVEMPIGVTGSDAIILPYSIQRLAGPFQDSDPFTRGGYAATASRAYDSSYTRSNSMHHVRWHNAVIQRPRHDDILVLQGRGVISRYGFLHSRHDPQEGTRALAIAFLVTTNDSNNDGYLDDRDPTELYIYEVATATIRAISPENSQVWSVSFSPETQTLYMSVVQDTNNDGRFDHRDEPTLYAYRLHTRDVAQPVLSEATLRNLERSVGR